MLTPVQLSALKTDINANTNTIELVTGVPIQIKNVLNNQDNNAEIANWYNKTHADFNVFRSNVPIEDIWDNVTGANYTPSDAITGANSSQWSACSLACQGKQFNLQLLMANRATFNAGKIKQRTTLNDATQNLPAGAAFALVSGGWSNILIILRRLAKNIEKLFAVQTSGVGVNSGDALGTTTNPALLVFEGLVSGDDITSARNS